MFCSLQRLKSNFQVRLPVDLRYRNIQGPLAKVPPNRKWRLLDDGSFRVLYRLQSEHLSQVLQEMRFFPFDTYFFAQAYGLIEY